MTKGGSIKQLKAPTARFILVEKSRHSLLAKSVAILSSIITCRFSQ